MRFIKKQQQHKQLFMEWLVSHVSVNILTETLSKYLLNKEMTSARFQQLPS